MDTSTTIKKNYKLMGTESDPVVIAQRLLNLYRQLHIFSPEKKAAYNQMLMEQSPEVKRILGTLPGGVVVQQYLSDIEEESGIVAEKFEGSASETAETTSFIQSSSAAQSSFNANVQPTVVSVASDPEMIKGIVNTFKEALAASERNHQENTKDLIQSILAASEKNRKEDTKELAQTIISLQNKLTQTIMDKQASEPRIISTDGQNVVVAAPEPHIFNTEQLEEVIKNLSEAQSAVIRELALSQNQLLREVTSSQSELIKEMSVSQTQELSREMSKVLKEVQQMSNQALIDTVQTIHRENMDFFKNQIFSSVSMAPMNANVSMPQQAEKAEEETFIKPYFEKIDEPEETEAEIEQNSIAETLGNEEEYEWEYVETTEPEQSEPIIETKIEDVPEEETNHKFKNKINALTEKLAKPKKDKKKKKEEKKSAQAQTAEQTNEEIIEKHWQEVAQPMSDEVVSDETASTSNKNEEIVASANEELKPVEEESLDSSYEETDIKTKDDSEVPVLEKTETTAEPEILQEEQIEDINVTSENSLKIEDQINEDEISLSPEDEEYEWEYVEDDENVSAAEEENLSEEDNIEIEAENLNKKEYETEDNEQISESEISENDEEYEWEYVEDDETESQLTTADFSSEEETFEKASGEEIEDENEEYEWEYVEDDGTEYQLDASEKNAAEEIGEDEEYEWEYVEDDEAEEPTINESEKIASQEKTESIVLPAYNDKAPTPLADNVAEFATQTEATQENYSPLALEEIMPEVDNPLLSSDKKLIFKAEETPEESITLQDNFGIVSSEDVTTQPS